MKLPFLLINFFLILMGCTHFKNAKSEMAVLDNYEIINFGEFHGTNEMPEIFFAIVKNYALYNHSKSIALGLELPKAEEDIVTDFFNSGDESHLKRSNFFNMEYQDGRASSAMVKSLKSLSGIENITIFCFDQNQPYTDDRDKVMAQNIISFIEQKKVSQVFTYSGNLHPQKKIGSPWDKAYKSMGIYLKELSNKDTIAIRGEFSGGEAWICQGMTPDTCGISKLGSIESKIGLKSGLHILGTSLNGYDAVYRLETITASLPWAMPGASKNN